MGPRYCSQLSSSHTPLLDEPLPDEPLDKCLPFVLISTESWVRSLVSADELEIVEEGLEIADEDFEIAESVSSSELWKLKSSSSSSSYQTIV